MKQYLYPIVLLLCLCSCVPSHQEFGARLAAASPMNLNQYAEFMDIKKKADNGDKAAQLFMEGARQHSIKQAFPFIQQAAEQNLSLAQAIVGGCYIQGVAVPKDIDKGVMWTKKAADQGEINAEATLGIIYYVGVGVPRDRNVAKMWFEKAAAQGEPTAKRLLKTYY